MAWLQLVGEDAHAPKHRVDGHCVDDVAGDEFDDGAGSLWHGGSGD